VTTPELRERAAQYVLGELAPAERAELEGRLAEDPDLAHEVEALRRLLGILPLGAAVDPPPALRARVLAALEPRAAAAAPRPTSRLVVRIVGAVAAVLALALGLDANRARRELSLERELRTALQQPNVVLDFTLAGRGDAAGARGRASLDLDARRGAVALYGLPPLPPERVYALWAAVGGRTVPCGAFRADPDGRVVAQFAVPVDAYAAPIARLFLTVESASPPAAPTGPAVMESATA